MTSPDSLGLIKGLGPALSGDRSLNALTGTSIFDDAYEFPMLTLNERAIDANIASMMTYVRAHGVRIAPHGKTAMSPQLAHRQLNAGAWAITAATPSQLRVYRHGGISRLLLANQLVEPSAIRWLRGELDRDPDFECIVTVDSVAGLELLAVDGTSETARPIDVLLEVGHPGGRTGTRSHTALAALAQHATNTPGVRVIGLTSYEGTLPGDTPETIAAAVTRFATSLAESATALGRDGLLGPNALISIGGSAYFDAALAGLAAGGIAPDRIVLRSGAYLTHDDGLYSRVTPLARGNTEGPSLQPAISVWAPVLSVPEPGLALLLCGRRDVGFDQGLPEVRGVRGRDGSHPRALNGALTQLADQHAFLTFDFDAPPASQPAVGDLVELGISHPCTTLDRWSLVPLVDDGYRVRDLIGLHFS